MNLVRQGYTFISYSRVDKEFALELARELKSAGFLVWLDQLDIPAGARWDDEIEKALHNCQIFLIILTPASISSENVKDEIGYAVDHGKRILPILLEKCAVPLRLRRFQYVDFTNMNFGDGIKRARQLLETLINTPSTPIPVTSVTVEASKDFKPIAAVTSEVPVSKNLGTRKRLIGRAGIVTLIAVSGTIAVIVIVIMFRGINPSFSPPSPWSGFFCQETEVCTAADVNGDGKADLIAFVRDTQPEPFHNDVWVGLSNGTTFENFKWNDSFCQANEICTAADVNGDGRADLIAFVRDSQSGDPNYEVLVSLSNGSAFESSSPWNDSFCMASEVCTAADVNGDGKADLIAFVRETQPEPGRGDVWVALSNGSAFETRGKWSDFFCQENELCSAADVNGDGRADLIAFVRDTQLEPFYNDVWVGLSNGTTFENFKWNDSFCRENEICTAADVNGDDKADLIAFVRDTQPGDSSYDVLGSLATRDAFKAAVRWSDFFCQAHQDCMAADVNGDGKADLIAFVRDTQPGPRGYDVLVSLEVK